MLRKINALISIANASKYILKTFSASKSKGSSKIWLERQKKDPYVKLAHKESYRARSAFKLIEINDKFKFIKPGDIAIDIGACPGSWTQVCVKLTNSKGDTDSPKGMVIGLDREFIHPIEGANVLSFCDINDMATAEKISALLNGRKSNSIISDMAPNSTGHRTFDHDAIISLQKKAFEFAKIYLIEDGYFLCKIWFGDTTKELTNELSANFQKVRLVKPDSSRDESAEIFVFCSGFKKNNKI